MLWWLRKGLEFLEGEWMEYFNYSFPHFLWNWRLILVGTCG